MPQQNSEQEWEISGKEQLCLKPILTAVQYIYCNATKYFTYSPANLLIPFVVSSINCFIPSIIVIHFFIYWIVKVLRLWFFSSCFTRI